MEKTYIVKPIKERKKWARLFYRKETMVSSYGLKNCLLFVSDFGIHFQFDRRTNEKKNNYFRQYKFRQISQDSKH